jgi:hypothetical protein
MSKSSARHHTISSNEQTPRTCRNLQDFDESFGLRHAASLSIEAEIPSFDGDWFDERVATLDFVYLAELTQLVPTSGNGNVQFICGMSSLVVDCCHKHEKIGAKKRKFTQRE